MAHGHVRRTLNEYRIIQAMGKRGYFLEGGLPIL